MAAGTPLRHIFGCMLPRRVVWGAVLAALVFGTSCESGADPEVQHPVDLVLDFCSSDVPVWVAHRNQGADWVRLVPNAEGSVSFTATNDVALAYVRQNGTDYDTEIVFAANTELEAVSGQTCRETSGVRSVNGAVSGVVGSQISQVAMAHSAATLQSSQTSFSLANLPDRPLDVIATRVNRSGLSQAADRVIIRRNQFPVSNATMPVLDFAAATTIVPAALEINVAGIGSGDFAFLASYFVSQLETGQILSYTEPIGNGAEAAFGVPQQDLAAGDYHDAFVIAVDQSGGTRGAERYFLAPTIQSLTLGGAMGVPTVTEAGTSPYLRLRAQVTRGNDYARAMRAEYVQDRQFSSTRVSVTITVGYSTAGTWDSSIPDLSAVSGWQNSWGLVDNGGTVDWTVTVFGGRPELLFGAPPGDGEVVRFASRANQINASVAQSIRSPTARLPRLFGRGR